MFHNISKQPAALNINSEDSLLASNEELVLYFHGLEGTLHLKIIIQNELGGSQGCTLNDF
jgi:hypothetical protein